MISLLIMAAGESIRYKHSKQLDKLYQGYSLMDFSIYDAQAAGFQKIVLIIREAQKDIFAQKYQKFIKQGKICLKIQDLTILPKEHSYQGTRTKPWGTAHCVYCAKDIVKDKFAVINCDDFYGRKSFEQMYASLKAPRQENVFFTMGYQLAKTLSASGPVSRGVCQIAHKRLVSIEEVSKIIKTKNKIMSDDRVLDKDAFVSMNFWGFTPFVQTLIAEYFLEFLQQKNLSEVQEFYLPAVIQRAIDTKQIVVELLPTNQTWFGLTYFEDRKIAVDKLGSLVYHCQYPSDLFLV